MIHTDNTSSFSETHVEDYILQYELTTFFFVSLCILTIFLTPFYTISASIRRYLLQGGVATSIKRRCSSTVDDNTWRDNRPESPLPEEGFMFRNQTELLGLANTNTQENLLICLAWYKQITISNYSSYRCCSWDNCGEEYCEWSSGGEKITSWSLSKWIDKSYLIISHYLTL